MDPVTPLFLKCAAHRCRGEGPVPSPFGDQDTWLARGKTSCALINQFPVTPGHALVVPYDTSVTRFQNLAQDELREHIRLARLLKGEFNRHFRPDGYNIGWNAGPGGGQSVEHAHMHIMPRYDAINQKHNIEPRGGIARMPFPELPYFWRRAGVVSDDAALISQFHLPCYSENEGAISFRFLSDRAVGFGHTMILTKTRGDFFTASEDAILAQAELAQRLIHGLNRDARPPDGYNIGWDIGKAAGQLGTRCALQVLPRYRGDIEPARGGIVRIIPERAWPVKTNYCDPANEGKDVPVVQKIRFPFERQLTLT